LAINEDPARIHPRTSMFVLATLAATNTSGPVRIRNLSPGGALVEGEALPDTGDLFRLLRGDLCASGVVIWREERRAGLRFEHDVEVAQWLPVGVVRPSQADSNCPPTGDWELLDLAESLDALANHLADDAEMVAQHGTWLQALDMTSQLLRRLAASRGQQCR